MKQFDKVLFVCKSNTSVSPMAEAILQERFRLEDILIESRGLVCLFPEPVNPKAEAILASHGLTMKNHTSISFGESDPDERTLILTMWEGEKQKILEEYPGTPNVFTLAEYVSSEQDLPDPYGGSMAEYGNCYDILKEMLDKLAVKMKEEDT